MNYDITPFQARAARQLAAAFGHLWATPPPPVIDKKRHGDTEAVAAWEADLEETLVRSLAPGVERRTRATWGAEAWGILAPTLDDDGLIRHNSGGKRISWAIGPDYLAASVHSGSMTYCVDDQGEYLPSGPVITVYVFEAVPAPILQLDEGRYRDDHADLAGRIMEALELPLDPRIVAARKRLRAAEIAEREQREAARAAELAATPQAGEPPQAEPVPPEYLAYLEPPWLTEARAE